jgi:hypothetical protein
MFDLWKKAAPVDGDGASQYVSEGRQAGQDMAPQSGAIFYVLIGLLFLPLGLAYGFYLVYRYVHEHL